MAYRKLLAAQPEGFNLLQLLGTVLAQQQHFDEAAGLLRRAIVAYLRRFRDQGATVAFRFEPEDIHVEGRMAVMVSKYWMTAQMPGRPQVRSAGRSMLIYRRRGRDWLLWRDIDNTTPDVKVE